VPDDTNEREDVFLWDSVTGTITRVSEDQAQGGSVSDDGRFVVYNAQWGGTQVFLWDATTGQTTHITEGFEGGSLEGGISADGRYVTLQSWDPNLVPDDTNGVGDVFVWDRLTETMTRITDGDGDSVNADFSADGRSIAFVSDAANLVTDDSNGVGDVFIWASAG
jgi:Tol biopolymer transport system component